MAALLGARVPVSSAAKIRGAVARWKAFLAFVGIGAAAVDWRLAVAFVVVRCCPPVGALIPSFCGSPVLPATAAGDVDCLSRASRLAVEGMAVFERVFSDERVQQLLRNIGARMKRLKTAKKPILFSQVAAFWLSAKRSYTRQTIHDAFAAVVAFFLAMRCSEVLALRSEDIDVIFVFSGDKGKRDRRALQVTFRSVKTRQSIFTSHDPFVVTCAHPTLMDAFDAFNDIVEFAPKATVFRGRKDEPLSRDWFAKVTSAVAPQRTPHSFRVGAATEMWAARVPLSRIMAVGRWASTGAILYIVGSLEQQVAATDLIGRGSLSYESDQLHQQLGTSLAVGDFPDAPVRRWAQVAARVESGESDGEE